MGVVAKAITSVKAHTEKRKFKIVPVKAHTRRVPDKKLIESGIPKEAIEQAKEVAELKKYVKPVLRATNDLARIHKEEPTNSQVGKRVGLPAETVDKVRKLSLTASPNNSEILRKGVRVMPQERARLEQAYQRFGKKRPSVRDVQDFIDYEHDHLRNIAHMIADRYGLDSDWAKDINQEMQVSMIEATKIPKTPEDWRGFLLTTGRNAGRNFAVEKARLFGTKAAQGRAGQDVAKIIRAKNEYVAKTGETPNEYQIATMTGLSKDRVLYLTPYTKSFYVNGNGDLIPNGIESGADADEGGVRQVISESDPVNELDESIKKHALVRLFDIIGEVYGKEKQKLFEYGIDNDGDFTMYDTKKAAKGKKPDLRGIPAGLRSTARLYLADASVRQIAKTLRKSKSGVQREIDEVRKYFSPKSPERLQKEFESMKATLKEQPKIKKWAKEWAEDFGRESVKSLDGIDLTQGEQEFLQFVLAECL